MPNEMIIVTDGSRTIEVKALSALEKMRVFKILPKGCEEKLLYVSMAFIAASVRVIDGKPMPFPQDEGGFELIIGLLGDSGVDAVQRMLAPEAGELSKAELETAAGN